MVGIGLIGFGYWGPKLLSAFQDVIGCQIIGICDLHCERLKVAQKCCPGVLVTQDYKDLLRDSRIDAAVVATPVLTHFQLALEALREGRHVLVEKPMTATSEQSRQLNEAAACRNLVLMVDHTLVYTGSVRKIQELMSTQKLGELCYYDSVRVNFGLFRRDVNVIWDLAVHDLSILDYIMPLKATAVSAVAVDHSGHGQETLGYLTLWYPQHFIAHIHVNWLAPIKIRRTLIGGSQTMVMYDELEPSEKVRVYNRSITNAHHDIHIIQQPPGSSHSDDVWVPEVDTTAALKVAAQHFLDCIESNRSPMTGGEAGWRAVRILEAATRSIAQSGQPIELEGEGGGHDPVHRSNGAIQTDQRRHPRSHPQSARERSVRVR